MLRLILLALPLVLCGLLHAPASAAAPACTSFVTSDGGSICLPEGWEGGEWDDLADLGEQDEDGLAILKQNVFLALLPGKSGDIVLVIGRLALCDANGRVQTLFPIAAEDILDSLAKGATPSDILSPKQKLKAGGKDYWRLVMKSSRAGGVDVVHSVVAADASYQLWLTGPLSRRAEMERMSASLLGAWRPVPGPGRLAGVPTQEWRNLGSKSVPQIRMSVPVSWKEAPESEVTGLTPAKGQRGFLATMLQARDTARTFGSAALHVQSLWVGDDVGGLAQTKDSQFFSDARSSMQAELVKELDLTLLGTEQVTVGRLTLSQYFYRQPKSYNGKPGGFIIGFVSGPGRLIAANLMYENLDDASWRAFLPEMFRRWEFSPSELKALGAAGPRS